MRRKNNLSLNVKKYSFNRDAASKEYGISFLCGKPIKHLPSLPEQIFGFYHILRFMHFLHKSFFESKR